MLYLSTKQKKNLKKLTKRNNTAILREKLQEELNELHDALALGNKENIIEEIADVYILINQYTTKYKLKRKISKQVTFKINRTLKLFKML